MELLKTLRKIRECESDTTAQLLLEQIIKEHVVAEREACAEIAYELQSALASLV